MPFFVAEFGVKPSALLSLACLETEFCYFQRRVERAYVWVFNERPRAGPGMDVRRRNREVGQL
jgi:hypothetical protein